MEQYWYTVITVWRIIIKTFFHVFPAINVGQISVVDYRNNYFLETQSYETMKSQTISKFNNPTSIYSFNIVCMYCFNLITIEIELEIEWTKN